MNIDQRTRRNTKVVANYRKNRGDRYGQDHKGYAGQIEVDGMCVMMDELHGKGLDIDILTKDLDTPSAKALKETNKRNQTNTKKGNDFNHTIKSAIGKGLDSQKKTGKKIWKKAKAEDSHFTHKQSKKHKGLLYKWTSRILRRRKRERGDRYINDEFYNDTRSGLCKIESRSARIVYNQDM